MSAIYQRARPTTFAEVVGQDHVKDVLTAAIARDRTGHAYLFSGPRGVGKTTTARLLAMAVNCEADDPEARPCGTCDSCRLVQAGNHPDVTELDAASNNSVEDVRDLREKVRLASLRGGVRVWILDEAHMLSRAAANALLKTLEEPPPGLVFVLATTEPEKLPPTILSRCQHFRFRRLSETEIRGKLARLCEAAGVEAESEALELVARAADGAMRDGESLLERLLAPGETITRSGAEAALGLPPAERLSALGAAIARGDLAALFAEADALYRDGFAPRTLAEQLTRHLQDVLVARVTGERADPAHAASAEAFAATYGDEGGEAGEDALMRAVHALDTEQERFTRRDDLYALEAALVKAVNAVRGFALRSPGDVAPGAATSTATSTSKPPARAKTTAPAGDTGAARDTTHEGSDDRGERAGSSASGASGEAAGGLPDFDPNRGAAPARDAAEAGAAAESGGAAAAPSAPIDMRAVKARASAQLKAFLMPARDETDGSEVTLRYGDRHAFHFRELKKRRDELFGLLAELGHDAPRVVVEGPDETLHWGGSGGKKAPRGGP